MAGFRLPGNEHIAVVHIDTLGNHAVNEGEELRVFGVVAGVKLGLHMQPERFAGKAFGHRDGRGEPVVLVGAVPVGTGRRRHFLADKVGGHVVTAFPHKRGVRLSGGVRLGGGQVVAGLVLPGRYRNPLAHAEALELIADHADALVQKLHSFPFLPRHSRGLTPF